MAGVAAGLFGGSEDIFSTFPSTPVVPLHPAIQAMLAAEAPGPPLDTLPMAEARVLREGMMLQRPRRDEPVARVEDWTIPGPGLGVPARVFTPSGGVRPYPILVFFHGGGWVFGTLDTHSDICRTLCHRSGSLVVSVDYRRAPEHRFPAALEDCCAAVQWCADHAAEIGGDPTRLAVAGDSAGGNLAAAAALRFRDEGGPALALQVLIYPVTNCAFDTASYHQYAAGYGLTRDMMRFFWKSYLSSPTDANHPTASPLQAADLAGLPPALVLTAQYDVLRDEGEAYAARLAQAAVPVRCTRYLEMNHGFVQLGALCDPALRGLVEISETVRTAFAR
jgi:acetyl esterase